MKKQLLIGAFALASFFTAQAQVLESENFDGLTVGNVGTALDGETAGQGGYVTLVPVGGDNSDFQIVAGAEGNALQISAGDEPAGTTPETANSRFMWRGGLGAAWAAKETANGLLSIEFDFNSAVVAGSTSQYQIVVYDAEFKAIGGYSYNVQTGILAGLVHFSQDGQAGTYNIRLAAAPGLVIPQNTWLRLGIILNPTTGQIIWGSNDIEVENEEGAMVPMRGSFTSPVMAGLVPAELDFAGFPGTGNAAASTAMFDKVVVKAVANTEEWLGTNDVVNVENALSVYPNPANDVVNVAAREILVNNIAVVDLNGRTVKNLKFDGASEASVNISDLSAGVYMMTISSDKGNVTKKIVKN